MIRRIQLAPLVIALGLISGSAHATLIGRDLNGSAGSFEAYYDTDLNITWLANNGDANGLMSWGAAKTWATNLSFTDGVNVYNNWRLPTALNQDGTGPCAGLNCTGSEMGHLFYSELGGTAGQSILTSSDPDLAKFPNLQTNYYWSGTEYALDTSLAWTFRFGLGDQGAATKYILFDALAVSPGDVGAVPEPNGEPQPNGVPEPQTLALVGLGLLGLGGARRRG